MNKIFVSDMDGTFLDTSSNVPHNFNDYLSEIKENDMHFVLASGRALYNMKHKMVNYLKDIDFISDNGAFVSVEGKTIYKSVMDKEIVLDLIEIGESLEKTSIVLVTENTAYVDLYNEEHRIMLYEYYLDFEVVKDLRDINEDVVKVTYLNLNNAEQLYHTTLYPKFKQDVNIVLAGNIWIDAMNQNVNKSEGLQILLDYYDLNKEQVYAFGDYHNDIELLEKAGTSYAVSNAHNDVKAIADHIIGSNDDNSVLKQISMIIKEK